MTFPRTGEPFIPAPDLRPLAPAAQQAPAGRTKRVYISASWKQRERVRALAVSLRANGHEVYDFTDPASRKTPEIPPERFPDQFDPDRHVYREYIGAVPEWRSAVECNREALRWCDVVVLLLPAGADSHADWALAVGMGKRSAVVGAPRAGERTPSHLWADALLDDDSAVAGWLLAAPAAQQAPARPLVNACQVRAETPEARAAVASVIEAARAHIDGSLAQIDRPKQVARTNEGSTPFRSEGP